MRAPIPDRRGLLAFTTLTLVALAGCGGGISMSQEEALALGVDFVLEIERFDPSYVRISTGVLQAEAGGPAVEPFTAGAYRSREVPDEERARHAARGVEVCELGERHVCDDLVDRPGGVIAGGIPLRRDGDGTYWVPVIVVVNDVQRGEFWARAFLMTVRETNEEGRRWTVLDGREWFSEKRVGQGEGPGRQLGGERDGPCRWLVRSCLRLIDTVTEGTASPTTPSRTSSPG